MDLITATIGFIFISVLWTFLLFGTMKNVYNVKRKSMILVMFFFMALALILLVVGAMMEYIESPEFCGTACHPRAGIVVEDTPMDPYYDSYVDAGNNKFMDAHYEEEVTCSKCHDKPGVTGKIKAFSGAFVEIVNYVSGNYDADNLETHFENSQCEKCHDGGVALDPGMVVNINGESIDVHDGDKKCNSCHSPHDEGIGYTAEACSSCHALSIDELNAHGITAGDDCMECHNRMHPEEAMLSFSEYPEIVHDTFCADCHGEVYETYSAWPEVRKSFYGDCTDTCHVEHKGKSVPHQHLDNNETNCAECHIYDIASHNPRDIVFYNYTGEIGLDFCDDCHRDEVDTYSSWYDDKKFIYGTCTTLCHKEHSKDAVPHDTSPPYDENCESCHLISTEIHEQKDAGYSQFGHKIEAEFCGSCHQGQLESLENGIHDSRDCIDCHGEHETISTNFESCTLCHDGIPANHDSKTSSCGICHSVDDIHARNSVGERGR